MLQEEGFRRRISGAGIDGSVAVQDPQGAIAMMNALHDRGIRMSIDDFGTGFLR
jgi:EAL domain-containing protein (putative c-di-GMP-specific phosphodiesterase class I)